MSRVLWWYDEASTPDATALENKERALSMGPHKLADDCATCLPKSNRQRE